MESPSMLAPTATAVHRKRTLPFIHHHYVLLKAHYFLYFSAFGIIAPIMNLTLRSRGLSTVELSYINIIIPFLVFFTNPLLGYIADHTRRYLSTFNIVLVISIAVFSGIFMLPPVRSNLIRGTLHYDNHNNNFLLQFSGSPEVGRECALRSACGCSYNATYQSTPAPQLPVLAKCSITCSVPHFCSGARHKGQGVYIIIYSLLFIIGTNLLQNAIALGASVGFATIDRLELFGEQRVFGTIGFGVLAFIASRVYEYFNTEFVYLIMFCVASVLCIVVTSFIRTLPAKQLENETLDDDIIPEEEFDDIAAEKKGKPKKDKSAHGASKLVLLLKRLDVILFLLLAFLWGMSYGGLDPYLYLYVDDLNPCNSRSIVGWMTFVSAVAEVTALYVAGRVIRILGTNTSSIIIFLAFSIRFGGYYIIKNPYYFTIMESMHFFNFGILYVAMTEKADSIAPPGLSGTLQGVALGVSFGLGRGAGLLFASFVYKLTGQPTLFLVFSLFNLIAGVIYTLGSLIDSLLSKNSKKNKNEITNTKPEMLVEPASPLQEEPLLAPSNDKQTDQL